MLEEQNSVVLKMIENVVHLVTQVAELKSITFFISVIGPKGINFVENCKKEIIDKRRGAPSILNKKDYGKAIGNLIEPLQTSLERKEDRINVSFYLKPRQNHSPIPIEGELVI